MIRTFQKHCAPVFADKGHFRHCHSGEGVPTFGRVVSELIEEMIEAAGCKLLFLPAYSPDLNKIEKFWACLKHWLCKTSHQFEEFWDTVDYAFKLCPN